MTVRMGYRFGEVCHNLSAIFNCLRAERAKNGKYGEYVKQDRRQELHQVYTAKRS